MHLLEQHLLVKLKSRHQLVGNPQVLIRLLHGGVELEQIFLQEEVELEQHVLQEGVVLERFVLQEQVHLLAILKSKHQLVGNLQVLIRLHYVEVEPRQYVLQEEGVHQLERVANLMFVELFSIE